MTVLRCRRHGLAGVGLAAISLLAAACGSSLSEAQVLARSGVQQGAPGTAGAGTPEAVASATVTGIAGAPAVSARPGAATAPRQVSGLPKTAPRPGRQATTGCTTKGSGPIVIGNVGNYSGAGASAQASMPKGVQVWAAAINAKGGLCGRKVQVLVQDDGGDPASYASLIRGMVENQHVVAFVGNGALLSVQGGIEYHKKAGVPVFGNDCTTDLWYSDPVFAPTCSTPHDQDVHLLLIGKKISAKAKFGYLYCREAQSCAEVDKDITTSAAREAGLTVAYRASISFSQVDFTAECQNARAAGVELFWVIADPATVSRVGQSCSRQAYRPQYLGGSVSMSPSNVQVDGLKNMAVGQPVFPFAGGAVPAIAEYDAARQQYAPDVQPDPAYALGWAGAKLFELVATRAAQTSAAITPATLRAALLTVRGETLGGLVVPLTFTSKGPRPASCMFAMQGDGRGGFKTPFGSGPFC